jgi:hypothetical protein
LSGSNSTNFYIQKALFWQKKSRTVMRTVKKSKMYLLIAREREKISQKFQRILIQQAKTIFLCKTIPEKLRCTVKNTRKLSLLIFRFRIKILKNEKSGIPK